MLIQPAVKLQTENINKIIFKYTEKEPTTCTTSSQNLSQSPEFLTIPAPSGYVQGNAVD